MQVLVVGGAGFIGSHIVDELLAAGHEVAVLSPGPELFRPPAPAVRYHFGRVEIGAHLEAELRGCDAVVDASTSIVPASADRSPASAISTGLGSATWLGELARAAGVRVHVYLSSGGTVYGRGRDESPHDETEALAPIGVYGALKASAELSLGALLGNSEVRFVGLRVANAYGERQNPDRPQGIVGVALNGMRAGRRLTLFGDTVRDLVHASDVATAVRTAIEGDLAGPYNVGSGEGVAMSTLLDRLRSVAGQELLVDHLELRPFDVPHSVLDVTRLRAAGWSPSVDLDTGLRRTWDWFRDLPLARA